MIKPIKIAAFRFWLIQLKPGFSRAVDRLPWWGGKCRVDEFPFSSPIEVAQHLTDLWVYTGDPCWGAIDFYTNPERVEFALREAARAKAAFQQRTWMLRTDCDCLAVWAVRALETIPGCTAKVVNLLDDNGVATHCVAHYTLSGNGWTRHGVIDTNNHHDLYDASMESLMACIQGLYPGSNYIEATVVPDPFA